MIGSIASSPARIANTTRNYVASDELLRTRTAGGRPRDARNPVIEVSR